MHVDLSEESVFQLFTSVDQESSGAIDFDEFSLALGSYSQVRT
jgi:Ca2+-binding EF-hand superfamily protein